MPVLVKFDCVFLIPPSSELHLALHSFLALDCGIPDGKVQLHVDAAVLTQKASLRITQILKFEMKKLKIFKTLNSIP